MSEPNFAREASLSAIARSMWRHRFVVGAVCVVIVAAATAVGFALPKTYKSTASILPAQEQSSFGGFLQDQDLGAAAPLAAALLGDREGGSTDLFKVMLESRVMADAVIAKFDLMAHHQVELIDDARGALAGSTTVSVSKEKALSVSVVTKDPALSADIANFYISHLDRLNRTMKVTKAGQTRAFLEARLAEAKLALVKAEESMRDFQSLNKAFAVDAQAQAMVEGAVALQSQLTAHEVELQVARGYLSEDNPELYRLRSAVEAVRRQLKMLESGPGAKGRSGVTGRPTMESVPSLALEYVRLLREVKTQEQIYVFLLAQLEQTKLQEIRDTPTIQLMDPAVPALRKSGPKVWLITFVALLLSLFASALLSLRLDSRATRQGSRPT
jgi:uncharacterized protein involved in exopolysaccharide biosynthesis